MKSSFFVFRSGLLVVPLAGALSLALLGPSCSSSSSSPAADGGGAVPAAGPGKSSGGLSGLGLSGMMGGGSGGGALGGVPIIGGIAGKPGECGMFKACGGDVVGTWSLTKVCSEIPVNMQMPMGMMDTMKECPFVLDTSGIKISLEATFSADKKMSSKTDVSGSMNLGVPTSCLMGASCAQVESSAKKNLSDPDSDLKSVVCSPGQGSIACNCKFELKTTSESKKGVYRIQGNVLYSQNDEDPAEEKVEFCVAGGDMKVFDPDNRDDPSIYVMKKK